MSTNQVDDARSTSADGSVVVVAGEAALLGELVAARVQASGAQALRIRRRDCDLRRPREARDMLRALRPDAVVHVVPDPLAAGDQARALYEAVIVGVELIEACRVFGVRRLVLGESRWTAPPVSGTSPALSLAGEPEPKPLDAVEIVRQMLDAQSALYRQQTSLDVSVLSLHNLYAPDPQYALEAGRIVADLQAAVARAMVAGSDDVRLTCSAPATRLLPVAQAAALVCAGIGVDAPLSEDDAAVVTLQHLAQAVAERAGFEGSLTWVGAAAGEAQVITRPGSTDPARVRLRDFVGWCLDRQAVVSA